jgi:hypothetical protein
MRRHQQAPAEPGTGGVGSKQLPELSSGRGRRSWRGRTSAGPGEGARPELDVAAVRLASTARHRRRAREEHNGSGGLQGLAIGGVPGATTAVGVRRGRGEHDGGRFQFQGRQRRWPTARQGPRPCSSVPAQPWRWSASSAHGHEARRRARPASASRTRSSTSSTRTSSAAASNIPSRRP